MIGSFTVDTLQALAETAVHDYGLDVIQPRWMEDDFTMDLIARDGTWMETHAFSCPRIRVDVLVLIPMLDDLIGLSYVEGVA